MRRWKSDTNRLAAYGRCSRPTALSKSNPNGKNHAAQALIDMARGIAQGDRKAAEAAFSKIDDDHPLSFTRDCAARHVVLTAGQTEKRVKAEIDSINPDSEFHASPSAFDVGGHRRTQCGSNL